MTNTPKYDTAEGVADYATMAEGYDGRTHIEHLHGLWAGTATENHAGLHSQQYTAETLAAAVPPTLAIIECTPYREMTIDDSIRVVLRPTGSGHRLT